MPRVTPTYHTGKIFTVLLLSFLLAWLTVSLPYVYQARQQNQETERLLANLSSEEETADSFGSNTEEKTATNTLSEFLDERDEFCISANGLIRHEPCAADDTYLAFHGELLVPPPEIAS